MSKELILPITIMGSVFILVLLYVPPIFYFKKGWFKKFYHDIIGWHYPDPHQKLKADDDRILCKYCEKEILQDSQGNWFLIDDYEIK